MERLVGALLVGLDDLGVRGGGDADQLLERLDHLAFGNFAVCEGDLAVFDTACRLHDDMLTDLGLNAAWIKIIYFSDFFKADSYNFSQNKFLQHRKRIGRCITAWD